MATVRFALAISSTRPRVSGGEILLGATRINGVSPRNRDVAMVFQNYALYPHMTVYENMAFGLRSRKLSRGAICDVEAEVVDGERPVPVGLVHVRWAIESR